MLQQQAGIQNYGYSLPKQLSNSSWKKCLQNVQNQTYEIKQQIFQGLTHIRQYLSQNIQVDILIIHVLQSQIHKSLIKYARKLLNKIVLMNQFEQIDIKCMYQILWIFTNLASGNKKNTSQVIEIGIVNFCKECFVMENYGDIIGILFQLLGNLAGQLNINVKLAFLSDYNFFNFMNTKYQNYLTQTNFHQNASWAFHNLFRDIPISPDQQNFITIQTHILPYFPIIQSLLQLPNQQAISNLLHIFFYLSKDQQFYMKQVIQIIQKFLYCNNQNIVLLVVQTIGNYIANCDEAVDFALNHHSFLNIVFGLLKNSKKTKIRKQAAWIISNIFGGKMEQVEKFVMTPTLFNELHMILMNQNVQSVLKELVWCIANCYSTCTQKAFQMIYDSSIVQQLSMKLRECTQQTIFSVYSQGIVFYLKKFQSNPNLNFNTFLKNLTQIYNGLKYIEQQQSLNSFKIVQNIIECRQKIDYLIKRGPITEEEMVTSHIQNFKF